MYQHMKLSPVYRWGMLMSTDWEAACSSGFSTYPHLSSLFHTSKTDLIRSMRASPLEPFARMDQICLEAFWRIDEDQWNEAKLERNWVTWRPKPAEFLREKTKGDVNKTETQDFRKVVTLVMEEETGNHGFAVKVLNVTPKGEAY